MSHRTDDQLTLDLDGDIPEAVQLARAQRHTAGAPESMTSPEIIDRLYATLRCRPVSTGPRRGCEPTSAA